MDCLTPSVSPSHHTQTPAVYLAWGPRHSSPFESEALQSVGSALKLSCLCSAWATFPDLLQRLS